MPKYGHHTDIDADALLNDDLEEEWIVPATDRAHRSQRISVTVPPVIAEAIQKTVESHLTPYEDKQEFLRHAISRHMAYIQWKFSGTVFPNFSLVHVRNLARLVHQDKLRREASNTLRELERRAQRMIADGDIGDAYKVLAYIGRSLRDMPPSSVQNRFEADFRAKYSEFLQSGGQVRPTATALVFGSGGGNVGADKPEAGEDDEYRYDPTED